MATAEQAVVAARPAWYAWVAACVALAAGLPGALVALVGILEGDWVAATTMLGVGLLFLLAFSYVATSRFAWTPDVIETGWWGRRRRVHRSDAVGVVPHPVYAHLTLVPRTGRPSVIHHRPRKRAQAAWYELSRRWRARDDRLPSLEQVGPRPRVLVAAVLYAVAVPAGAAAAAIWEPEALIVIGLWLPWLLMVAPMHLTGTQARIVPAGLMLRRWTGRWMTIPWAAITSVRPPPGPRPRSWMDWRFYWVVDKVRVDIQVAGGRSRSLYMASHPPGASYLFLNTLRRRLHGRVSLPGLVAAGPRSPQGTPSTTATTPRA